MGFAPGSASIGSAAWIERDYSRARIDRPESTIIAGGIRLPNPEFRAKFKRRTLEALDAELGKADIVVNCLPHTLETRGLIDQNRLSKFKDGALFVNIGRGSVIDETALVDALQEGSLGGAVIDVTQREPIPEDHPLWDCPNTILTQHTAGRHSAELTEKALFFLENLQRYREGAALKNIVDFTRGY